MMHAYITTEQDIPNIVGQGRYFALQFSDGYASSVIITGVRVMVFNATFNNISVISWLSVLLVEETGVPRENHRPAVRH